MYQFPPKQTASVLGEKIEFVTAGAGPSTIVLVNGSGGPVEGWHKVFGPISGFARVFAYNRPGIGASSKPASPQVGSYLVASLRSVLAAAGLHPPYVLVGHSLGGLIVNLFARRYPSDVAAAVMLEATAPQDVGTLAHHENALQRLARGLLERLAPPDPHAETQHLTATVSELQTAPAFPAIPLYVVTGGKPAMAWATAPQALAARAEHQRSLVALSPLSTHVILERSGHFPQFSEPELVTEIVKKAARSS